MSEGLFRHDVLDARRGEWLGAIRIASPPSHWIYSSLAGVITVSVVGLLAFGHYTRRQTVAGSLVPSMGLLNVSASMAGTVEKTYVHDGQKVVTGQPLAEISAERDSPSMGLIDALIVQSLHSQALLLRSDLANQKQLVATQMSALQAKLAMLKSQRTEIEGQIDIQRQDVSSTEAVLARFHSIGNGAFISALQMQQQQTTVFTARAQLKSLERDRIVIIQQISQVEHQLVQLPLTAASQANSTDAKLAGIRQQLAKTAGARSIILRAPAAGTVSTMVVDPGQSVRAGQSVISVMPAGSVLRAQLLVPSRAIGFIHPGSRLNLRYAAFPYQEFGQYHGVVTSISRSALTPTQVAGLTQEQTKRPLYRVMVRLDRQRVDVYGRPERLKAGLGLNASVMLDRRRLIQWVFEPLYGLSRNIFVADRVHSVAPAMAVPRPGSTMPMNGSHA